MSLSQAPHISDVDPNSPEFRRALAEAGVVLSDEGDLFCVYSRHKHYVFAGGEVVFEEEVMPGELALYPVSEKEARVNGLPSCWAFTEDGTVVVMRYASRTLHERSGIDVMSDEFQARLAAVGRGFAAAGLHQTLELNIAGKLFPHGKGEITYEVTDPKKRHQVVTVIPMPDDLARGEWGVAACWSFDPTGKALVTGMCNRNGSTTLHPV